MGCRDSLNIFFLDRDPATCATAHVDRHVVKMPLESAQMLSTAYRATWRSVSPSPLVYKTTHLNHPCSVWARESTQHYSWLCLLGLALCNEFAFRYDHEHKAKGTILWLQEHSPNIADAGWIDPPKCFGNFSTDTQDAVEAYREYYVATKEFDKNGKLMATWKNREKPEWWR